MVAFATRSELDRLRELVLHAHDGSPIAMETVRSHLRLSLLNATPTVLLALADRLVEVKEAGALPRNSSC